jgi:hypothetical protein
MLLFYKNEKAQLAPLLNSMKKGRYEYHQSRK